METVALIIMMTSRIKLKYPELGFFKILSCATDLADRKTLNPFYVPYGAILSVLIELNKEI